jgi:hypothetical protein
VASTAVGASANQTDVRLASAAILRDPSVRGKAMRGLLALGPSARKAVLLENWASTPDSDSLQDTKTLAVQARDEILAEYGRQV